MVVNWGAVPDWIVAVTAVVGVAFASVQLRIAARSQRDQLQIAKATLLRELDRDFESDAIRQSRLKLLVIRSRFEVEAAAHKPALSHSDQVDRIAKLVSAHIHDIWEESRRFDGDKLADKDKSADEYALIMRLPYWCETVGHLCRRNLMPMDDLLDLYDQLIILCIGNVRDHITLRAESLPYKNRRFLQNALWLYAEAIKYREAHDAPNEKQLNAAPLRWDG